LVKRVVNKKALSIARLKCKALVTAQENRPIVMVVSRTKETIFQMSVPLTEDLEDEGDDLPNVSPADRGLGRRGENQAGCKCIESDSRDGSRIQAQPTLEEIAQGDNEEDGQDHL
jgi:hypothetical protein